MNMNLKMVARDGYTILDFLSDIGGILGLLVSGITYILVLWNYNHFENFMVTRLFKL